MAITRLSKPVGSVPAVFHVDSYVSTRFGFVYHCVPKALSRSMLEYLATVDPDGYRIGDEHVGKEILEPCSGSASLTSFTFVRNPYSRIVAVYYDKFVNYRHTPAQRAMFARYEGLRPDMAFSEFVDWLATDEGDDRRADPHFLSQHYFLLDVNGDPAIDYLGKVESVEDDMSELQGILGLAREPLPHVNANTMRARERFDTSRRWLEVLDDHSKRVLANRYDGDFELLGYDRLPYAVRPLFSRGAGAQAQRSIPHRGLRTTVKRLLATLGLEVRRTRPKPRRSGGTS